MAFLNSKRKRSQRQAATTAAELQAAQAQFPDLLLVGADSDGKEHRLKINGNGLIRAGERGQMIGRSAHEADYMLNLDYVSRRHCLLQIRGGQIYVTDLDSANGTAINGNTLPPQQAAVISNGDELQLGPLALRVLIVAE